MDFIARLKPSYFAFIRVYSRLKENLDPLMDANTREWKENYLFE